MEDIKHKDTKICRFVNRFAHFQTAPAATLLDQISMHSRKSKVNWLETIDHFDALAWNLENRNQISSYGEKRERSESDLLAQLEFLDYQEIAGRNRVRKNFRLNTSKWRLLFVDILTKGTKSLDTDKVLFHFVKDFSLIAFIEFLGQPRFWSKYLI